MNSKVTCIDIYSQQFEVPVNQLVWRPSVYGIVIRDGYILLSKQFKTKYDLPGGGLNLGENPEDGAIREVKEETGIDVMNPRLLGLENSYFQSSHSKDNKSYHCILMYFVCDHSGGELSTEGFDKDERGYAELAEWVSVEKIDNIELASTVDYRKYIKACLSMV